MPTIELSDDIYAKLERLARPFVDREPADVIRRLVDGDSGDPTGGREVEDDLQSRQAVVHGHHRAPIDEMREPALTDSETRVELEVDPPWRQVEGASNDPTTRDHHASRVVADQPLLSRSSLEADVEARAPRERGGVFILAGRRIEADSVRHLYEQVLEYMDNAGLWNRLEALAPYKTSSKRYLVSTTAVHPNGRDFFIPVSRRGLFMETHKNYVTATKQLRQLLDKCGIPFEYGGGS